MKKWNDLFTKTEKKWQEMKWLRRNDLFTKLRRNETEKKWNWEEMKLRRNETEKKWTILYSWLYSCVKSLRQTVRALLFLHFASYRQLFYYFIKTKFARFCSTAGKNFAVTGYYAPIDSQRLGPICISRKWGRLNNRCNLCQRIWNYENNIGFIGYCNAGFNT